MSIESVMLSNHLILCHLFILCLQSFLASVSFPMSRLFASGGQSTGASASASDLPMNIQGWFPLVLIDLLAVQGTRKSLLWHYNSKASILQRSAFFVVQVSHPYMTTGKNKKKQKKQIDLTIWTFVSKVISLLFNVLSRFVIAFLPRRKCLLISWLKSLSTVILESKKIKSVTASIFPIYLPCSDRTWCHFLFLILRFKPALSLSSFTFIKRLFSSSSFSAIRVVSKEGNGTLLQYFCLENPLDGGAW